MIVNEEKKNQFLNESAWSGVSEYLNQLEKTDHVNKLLYLHEYISNLVASINSDLIPLERWEHAIRFANAMAGNFRPNDVMGSMDEVLTAIAPYVTNSRDAAKAAGQAFSMYAKDITKERELQNGKVEEMVSALTEKIEKAAALLSSLETHKTSIEKYTDDLLNGTEEKDSISRQIERMLDDITKHHAKAETFLEELVGAEEDDDDDEGDHE